jgi:DNA-directed RNA polymerase subunit RPC12/RpoP
MATSSSGPGLLPVDRAASEPWLSDDGTHALPQINLVLDDEASYRCSACPASLTAAGHPVRRCRCPRCSTRRSTVDDDRRRGPDLFSAPARHRCRLASVFDGTDPNGQWRPFVMNDG